MSSMLKKGRKQREREREREREYVIIYNRSVIWEAERTDLRATEYRYPPLDRGKIKSNKKN